MREPVWCVGAVVTFFLATGLAAAAAPTERMVRDREVVSDPRPVHRSPLALAQPARVHPAIVSSSARFLVESNSITFGEVLPGLPAFVPTAMVVRVFSERRWALKLIPTSALNIHDRGDTVSLSRLQWRSSRRGNFSAFNESAPAVIASGAPTTSAGELVTVDLRLVLSDDDPIGNYGCNFRVEVEQLP